MNGVAVFPDVNVKALLMENEKVLKLIHSELLQTEIRVLYELLYNLNNSYRGNKTFKGLKQVRSVEKGNISDHSTLMGNMSPIHFYLSYRLNNA